MGLSKFELRNHRHHAAAADVWSVACGYDFSITPRFVEYNTRPTTGVAQEGRLAEQDGSTAGFVLASCEASSGSGWVDAIAVHPEEQKHGLGRRLLEWAEGWLKEQGSRYIRVGGSLRPFMPGPLAGTGGEAFFLKRGYPTIPGHSLAWDLSNQLKGYRSVSPQIPGVEVRAMVSGEESQLLAFLEAEFPGRWHFEALEFILEGNRLEDYLLLWTERGVEGFCCTTREDSGRPIERYYPQRLPKPWGQLGSIGVSAASRGKGYGRLLIDAALLYLQSQGVDGCVIDWTGLLELYGKFGFRPYTQYTMLFKAL